MRTLIPLIGVLLACGCIPTRPRVAQVAAPPEIIQSQERIRKEYVWAPGDQIEVNVRRVPEASRLVTIRPDGVITLPLVDDIQAAGLTARELKENLTKAFAMRLSDPEVSVIAVQVPPATVYVLGEVGTSMPVPLRNAATAIEAITFAGGFRRTARAEDTTVIRLGEDGYLRALPVSNAAQGQPGPVIGLRSMLLQPDDIVFVPESGRSQVARFLDDLVNRPLTSISGTVGLYFNFRLIRVLTR